MCPVDRRRYRDGDFNGQWTSQLAPFQCSGILFPPRCSFTSFFTSLRFTLSFFLVLSFFSLVCSLSFFYIYLSMLVFLPVSPLFVFSLYRSAGLSPLPHIFLSFCFCCQAKLPIYMRPGRLPDCMGYYRAPLSPRTREHRKPGSYLIRGEVYSPVDSNWARNHRALLFSVRTLKKSLTNSRFLAYYCRTVPPSPSSPQPFTPIVVLSNTFSLFLLDSWQRADRSFWRDSTVSINRRLNRTAYLNVFYIMCLCVFIFYKNWDDTAE